MVSIKSGQVAIASGSFLTQYSCYVSKHLSAILSLRGFILWPVIPANGAYR
jgi:hypothetical protein